MLYKKRLMGQDPSTNKRKTRFPIKHFGNDKLRCSIKKEHTLKKCLTTINQATEINFEYKNILKPFYSLCSRELDFKNYRAFKSRPLSAQRKDLKQGLSFGIKGISPCALWFDCRI